MLGIPVWLDGENVDITSVTEPEPKLAIVKMSLLGHDHNNLLSQSLIWCVWGIEESISFR